MTKTLKEQGLMKFELTTRIILPIELMDKINTLEIVRPIEKAIAGAFGLDIKKHKFNINVHEWDFSSDEDRDE